LRKKWREGGQNHDAGFQEKLRKKKDRSVRRKGLRRGKNRRRWFAKIRKLGPTNETHLRQKKGKDKGGLRRRVVSDGVVTKT